MSRPDFANLAERLLVSAIQDTGILTEAHVGLLDSDDGGTLDAAFDELSRDNLAGALAHLDASIKLAALPPATPTEGRNRLERHQRNALARDHLLTVAQICRVLVLDAIKQGGAA